MPRLLALIAVGGIIEQVLTATALWIALAGSTNAVVFVPILVIISLPRVASVIPIPGSLGTYDVLLSGALALVTGAPTDDFRSQRRSTSLAVFVCSGAYAEAARFKRDTQRFRPARLPGPTAQGAIPNIAGTVNCLLVPSASSDRFPRTIVLGLLLEASVRPLISLHFRVLSVALRTERLARPLGGTVTVASASGIKRIFDD